LTLAEFVESKPKEYILSVPAIWSDLAKNKTLECAFNAGYGDRNDPSSIRLVSEPEAAAIYAITTVIRSYLWFRV
jgi:molecular chaperone DnaK (HSP70)